MSFNNPLEYKFDVVHPSKQLYIEILTNYVKGGEYIIKKVGERSYGNEVVYLTNKGNWISGFIDKNNNKIIQVINISYESYTDLHIKCIKIHSFRHPFNHSKFRNEIRDYINLVNTIDQIRSNHIINIKN